MRREKSEQLWGRSEQLWGGGGGKKGRGNYMSWLESSRPILLAKIVPLTFAMQHSSSTYRGLQLAKCKIEMQLIS